MEVDIRRQIGCRALGRGQVGSNWRRGSLAGWKAKGLNISTVSSLEGQRSRFHYFPTHPSSAGNVKADQAVSLYESMITPGQRSAVEFEKFFMELLGNGPNQRRQVRGKTGAIAGSR